MTTPEASHHHALLNRGYYLVLGGVFGVCVAVLAASMAKSLLLVALFVAGAAAFGAGTWYSLPVRREELEKKWLVYLLAGAIGLLDAVVLTVTHASMGGWETLFIAAHYLAGTAFVLAAGDGLRRATGN